MPSIKNCSLFFGLKIRQRLGIIAPNKKMRNQILPRTLDVIFSFVLNYLLAVAVERNSFFEIHLKEIQSCAT